MDAAVENTWMDWVWEMDLGMELLVAIVLTAILLGMTYGLRRAKRGHADFNGALIAAAIFIYLLCWAITAAAGVAFLRDNPGGDTVPLWVHEWLLRMRLERMIFPALVCFAIDIKGRN